MPHSNNYSIGNESGGQYPSGVNGPADALNSVVQSQFGDSHPPQQQQQQSHQEKNPPINPYLQHHSFANTQQQPSQQQQQQQVLAPQQQQQFLPGPFYTLQQQQAFAQARARLAAAAQAQQWQQQLAQVQFQAQQQQLQGATITTSPPQQNVHSFQLVGQHQNSQSQLSHSSSTPAATVALAMPPALNFTINASEHGPEAMVAPAAALHATSTPSASSTGATTSAPAVAAEPTRRRLSGTKSQLAAKPTINDSNTSSTSMKYHTTMTASKKKQPENNAPDSCVSSGISSSAAKLIQNAMDESNTFEIPSESSTMNYADGSEPSYAQKKQSSRDRNREHARCTRLRKKAYVDKLKELVDGLHGERNEDARKRRAAVQRLAKVQELRRKVVNTFLEYHCKFESDYNKWKLIVETGDDGNAEEEEFWMKQPVTPYRSFRRCEIQKGSRILKGIDALVRDSASMAVMIETIGSRNLRWLQRKRDDFLGQYSSKRNHPESSTAVNMPHTVRQNRQTQHAISSLSSCSGSSTEFGSSSEEERKLAQRRSTPANSTDDIQQDSTTAAKNVTSSSSSNDTNQRLLQHQSSSNDFHDYNAPSLPDPLPRSVGSSSSIADGIDSDNCVMGIKQMSSDSSSGEDEKPNTAASEELHHQKKRKIGNSGHKIIMTAARAEESNCAPVSQPSIAAANMNLPPNIARSGGIFHNVKVMTQSRRTTGINAQLPNGHANLSRAPATALPPFAGIGKRKQPPATSMTSSIKNVNHMGMSTTVSQPSRPPLARNSDTNITSGTSHHNGGNINNINSHNNRSSSNFRFNGSSDQNIITFDYSSVSSSQPMNRGIEAHYHINEDDMILTDDVLMCPFIFRSREAVRYGALAECVQPGMLRACFSPTSKLRNIEMIFDAMGFCQQLERASGNEGMAHIIPNSLEMALAPNSEEARVITLAKPPFKIVYVNEPWTAITGYTQLNAEGKDLSMLHWDHRNSGEGVSSGVPHNEYANAANGVCTSGTYSQFDINGRELLNFTCSYPLSNLKDEVTHILHVCKELPARA